MDTKEAGKLGGEARKRALTPQRRSEIAKHAVAMREKRRKAKKAAAVSKNKT